MLKSWSIIYEFIENQIRFSVDQGSRNTVNAQSFVFWYEFLA